MAQKINKVSVNQFQKAITKNNDEVVNICLSDSDPVDITVKYRLSLDEMISFVADVVSSCVDQSDGSYSPEAYRFAIRVATITKYSNLTMPTNISKQYEFAYNTLAFGKISAIIDKSQFNEIIEAIDKKIEYILSMQRAEITAGVNEAIGRMKQITDLFDTIDAEDVKSLAGGLAKIQSIDNEDIVNAIIAQKE